MEPNAIEKVLMVLSSFAPNNRPVGTVELAKQLGMHKATVSRIFNTLKRHGYLDQDLDSRMYRLGPAVAELSHALSQSLEGQLLTVAKPHIDKLRDALGETVHLEIMAGNQIFLAYTANGFHQVMVVVGVGDHTLPYVHAGAKAIAAFCSNRQREEFLQGELKAFTPNTMTDPVQIRLYWAQVRKTGVAFDRGELNEEVMAIAAPVFNHESKPVAAVVIRAPSFRMLDENEELLVRELKRTAAAISAGLMSTRAYPE